MRRPYATAATHSAVTESSRATAVMPVHSMRRCVLMRFFCWRVCRCSCFCAEEMGRGTLWSKQSSHLFAHLRRHSFGLNTHPCDLLGVQRSVAQAGRIVAAGAAQAATKRRRVCPCKQRSRPTVETRRDSHLSIQLLSLIAVLQARTRTHLRRIFGLEGQRSQAHTHAIRQRLGLQLRLPLQHCAVACAVGCVCACGVVCVCCSGKRVKLHQVHASANG